MAQDGATLQAATPAPLPANISVAGGAGVNMTTPYQVAALPGQIVLTVGTGMEFQTIGDAVAAAQNGDLILVQPGTYVNDFADVTAQVTIAGAGGMVNVVATVAPPSEKGIFVVDNNCQIDNFSFQGAAIPVSEGGNAAGIRDQGGNLVLNNDSFIGNQNGLLAAAVDGLPQNTVSIFNSTFDNNGQSSGPDAGYTHNVYASTGISSLVAKGDVFERAQVGHELKSRAAANLISGNIFYDGPNGTASYSIDLPDGGADTVSGNLIEKGPNTQNSSIIHFGGEGIPYAGSSLLVTGNHFINDLGTSANGVLNQTTLNVSVVGNEFDNFAGATLGSGAYTQSGNWDQDGNAIAASGSNQFAPGTDLFDYSGDSLTHSLTLTQGAGVRGGGGLLTVDAEIGHVTVLGGSGGLNFVEAPGYGGSYIATFAGAADTVVALGQDTVEAEGNDSILGGDGNLTVQIDGQASISGASADNAYIVNGALSLAGDGGSDTVQVNSANASAMVSGAETYFQAASNGGTVAFSITEGGAGEQATLIGGAAVQVYNGSLNVTTAGGSSGTLIDFGTGTVSTCFSHGADTIYAGSGADTIIATANADIFAGTGSLSVFGRSEAGTATVNGAAGTVYIGGDGGGIAYIGSGKANTVVAALANIALQGGAGLMSVAGGCNQTVIGGSGGMAFTTSGGNDQITTAAGARDSIAFQDACVLVSNGRDTISAGDGNATVTANGTASINGSTGNAFYTLNGHDTLVAQGYSRITVGAAAADTVTSLGSLTNVVMMGGTLVFSQAGSDHEAATVAGAGATVMAGSGGQASLVLDGAGDRATLGGGHLSAVLQAGVQVHTGGGSDTITAYGGGNVIVCGSGTLSLAMADWVDNAANTVIAGSAAVNESGGYGNLIFVGGSGRESLGGIFGGETVSAGSGNMSLVGGSNGTAFAAGSGSDVVTLTQAGGTVNFGNGHCAVTEAGYGTAVVYDFTAGRGGGVDVINGFRNGVDQLVLQGVSIVQQNMVAGADVMTLSDGTHVTLAGITTPMHFALTHH